MSTAQIIADRYKLADPIGSGAMGAVYRATDTQSGATVAIKALKPDLVARDPASRVVGGPTGVFCAVAYAEFSTAKVSIIK